MVGVVRVLKMLISWWLCHDGNNASLWPTQLFAGNVHKIKILKWFCLVGRPAKRDCINHTISIRAKNGENKYTCKPTFSCDKISFSIMKCERKMETVREKKKFGSHWAIIYKNQPTSDLNGKYRCTSEWLKAIWFCLTRPFIGVQTLNAMLHINNLAFNLNVNYAANATEAATFYARHYTVPVRCQILMYSTSFARFNCLI